MFIRKKCKPVDSPGGPDRSAGRRRPAGRPSACRGSAYRGPCSAHLTSGTWIPPPSGSSSGSPRFSYKHTVQLINCFACYLFKCGAESSLCHCGYEFNPGTCFHKQIMPKESWIQRKKKTFLKIQVDIIMFFIFLNTWIQINTDSDPGAKWKQIRADPKTNHWRNFLESACFSSWNSVSYPKESKYI